MFHEIIHAVNIKLKFIVTLESITLPVFDCLKILCILLSSNLLQISIYSVMFQIFITK